MPQPSQQTNASNDQAGGLYVHVPFCDSKCGYCDFYSVASPGRDYSQLVRQLEVELQTRLSNRAIEVATVFVGGGTPTVLSADVLGSLLSCIGCNLDMERVVEFSVEANPATVDDQKAEAMAAAGVTRVSMGAQSFMQDELSALERLHTPEDIAPSVATLRRHGIGQISLDLISGIPGQTVDTWSISLARAIDLDPDHIACYGLTYEPGTRLTAQRDHGRVIPCDEDREAKLFMQTIETLAQAGFEQYEISNFAKPGSQCQHNLIYWRNEPYIGVGPSAVGCVNGRRYKNISDVAGYVRLIDQQGHAEVETELIDTPTLINEMILMQLRLVEGISIESFKRRTAHDPVDLFGETLKRLVDTGHMTVSLTHIALTTTGRLVADAIMTDLAAAAESLQET